MPFTLSHAAAVLPLRERLPLAALLVGSVSPDFGYYFGVTEYLRLNAHTIPRSFSFCLPMGFLLLLLLFPLRAGIAMLLPGSLAVFLRSLFSRSLFTPSALPITLAAILIGAWTHIFWDSFTHHTGYFVHEFSLLRLELMPSLELYRLLQHLSTAVGGIVVAVFVSRECRQLGQPIEWRFSWRWALWASLAIFAALFTFLTLEHPWNYALANNDRRLWFLAIVSVLRNAFLLLLLAAIPATLFSARRGARASAAPPQ